MTNSEDLNSNKCFQSIGVYVSVHKAVSLPEGDFFIPVLTGSSQKSDLEVGYLRDNVGDHISDKHESYCELTVLYWAWKNQINDVYGFSHYRRFLDLSRGHRSDIYGNYYIDSFSDWNDKKFGYSKKNISNIFKHHDIVIGNKIDVRKLGYKNNFDHYISQEFLHENDLKTLLDVIKERQPKYYESACKYFDGYYFTPCNLFITTREILNNYCQWLFDLLLHVEGRLDLSKYSRSEMRVLGHLGERLLGIFLQYHKELVSLEVPIVFIKDSTLVQSARPIEGEIPVVMCTSPEFLPVLSVTLNSIKKTSSRNNNYVIYILHTKPIDKTKLRREFQNSNLRIVFLNVTPYLKGTTLPVNHHLSGETYYRLLLGKIFQQCSKVIYLDTDVIVLKDLATLYNHPLNNSIIAGVVDPDHAGQVSLHYKNVRDYTINKLGLKDPFTYIQAGVLVMNPEAMEKFIPSDELLKVASNNDFTYLDQDILNFIFHGHISYLDPRWNVLTDCGGERLNIISKAPLRIENDYLRSREDPFVIHYAGYQKPWNCSLMDFSEVFWINARDSVYYEYLLAKLIKRSEEHSRILSLELVKKFIKKRLPEGSYGRVLLSRIYRKLTTRKYR